MTQQMNQNVKVMQIQFKVAKGFISNSFLSAQTHIWRIGKYFFLCKWNRAFIYALAA